MSKKTKTVAIVAKNQHLFGKKVNLPNVGKTEVSEEGEVEVDEETAAMLVGDGNGDWNYKQAPASEDDEEEEEEDSKGSKSEEDDDDKMSEETLDKELTKTLIKNVDEEDLKKMAKENGVAKSVMNKAKNKADLVKMILNKLTLEEKQELYSANKAD